MQAGKCKNGKHKIIVKTDGSGREFVTCETCGNTPVKIKHNGTTKII